MNFKKTLGKLVCSAAIFTAVYLPAASYVNSFIEGFQDSLERRPKDSTSIASVVDENTLPNYTSSNTNWSGMFFVSDRN